MPATVGTSPWFSTIALIAAGLLLTVGLVVVIMISRKARSLSSKVRLLNEHLDMKYASLLQVRAQMVELARAQLRAGESAAARRTFLQASKNRRQGSLGPRIWTAGFVAVFLPFLAGPLRSLAQTVRGQRVRCT